MFYQWGLLVAFPFYFCYDLVTMQSKYVFLDPTPSDKLDQEEWYPRLEYCRWWSNYIPFIFVHKMKRWYNEYLLYIFQYHMLVVLQWGNPIQSIMEIRLRKECPIR